MIQGTAIAATATAALSIPALGDYLVNAGTTPAPTYGTTLDFDEPGGPTGVVSTDAWASLGLAEMQAGDSMPQVDDWATVTGQPCMVFDEVRVLGFGFIPTTYMDNTSWNAVPAPSGLALLGVAGFSGRRHRRA